MTLQRLRAKRIEGGLFLCENDVKVYQIHNLSAFGQDEIVDVHRDGFTGDGFCLAEVTEAEYVDGSWDGWLYVKRLPRLRRRQWAREAIREGPFLQAVWTWYILGPLRRFAKKTGWLVWRGWNEILWQLGSRSRR